MTGDARQAGRARPLIVLPYPKFVERIEYGPTDECWLWTGNLNERGYGHFFHEYKHLMAHRFAHMLWIGPIPAGLVVDHLCFVRNCVNPRHLEAVTPQVNIRRMNDRLGNGLPECRRCGSNDWYRRPTQAGRQCRPCALRHKTRRSRNPVRSTR